MGIQTFPRSTFSRVSYLISALILCLVLAQGQGASQCTRKTKTGFFKMKETFTCPRPGDPRDFIYCCGDDDDQSCCKNPFGLDDETVQLIEKNIGTIVAVIVGAIGFIIVACLLCCCLCPFCLLYKRRHAGSVYQAASQTPAANVTVAHGSYPMQSNPNNSSQPSYPVNPPSYPGPQPSYPGAQPSYPPAQPGYTPGPPAYGYDAQGNAPPPGFSVQPPYPGYPPNQNAPYPVNDAYQKAPPYNPNY